MLFVLSPAKSLDYTTPAPIADFTEPLLTGEAAKLIKRLKSVSPAELSTLMGISDPLAQLNVGRYAAWSRRATPNNAKQAIFAFNGDVYEGLQATTLNRKALDYAQSHIRILSGLYGILRPFDLLQPYRLEMGTRLDTPLGKNLYEFWGHRITDLLNDELKRQRSSLLVNLASEEYFKSVRPAHLDAEVITPVFQDWHGGKFKIISFHAKRTRGLMARFAAQQHIKKAEQLKAFALDGYAHDADASSGNTWVFRRRLVA